MCIRDRNYSSFEVPVLPTRRRCGEVCGEPLVLCFPRTYASSVLLFVMVPNTEQEYCIGSISIMDSLDLPRGITPDYVSSKYQSPNEIEVKKGACGTIGQRITRVEKEETPTIQAVDDCFLDGPWLDFVDYISRGREIMFLHSTNRDPNTIFKGKITGRTEPRSRGSSQRYDISLRMSGYTDQEKK